MHRALCLVVLLLIGGAASGPAWAGPRVALVVGVGAYRKQARLANTVNDARAVAAALKGLGFAVETVTDPDRTGLELTIERFAERARGADAAVFFYAGHAVELDGHNWLVPASANIRKAADMPGQAVILDSLTRQLNGAARLTLILLDSCRDNPFRNVLAGSMQGMALPPPLVGSLIVYSTAPGTVASDGSGPHSPFTTALLHYIDTPGLEVNQLMEKVRRQVRQDTGGRQIPWDSSSLEGPFYFAPAGTAAIVQRAAPAVVVVPRDATDEQLWRAVQGSGDGAGMRRYLARYPRGHFAALARARLGVLAEAAAPQAPQDRAMVAPMVSPLAMATPAPAASGGLAGRLAGDVAGLTGAAHDAELRRYLGDASLGRALAVAPRARGVWQVAGRIDNGEAEETVLEGCQIFYHEPCVLLGVGSEALRRPVSGDWPLHSMIRAIYSGRFEPAQIPAVPRAVRIRPDIAGYRAVSGGKAIALYPGGGAFVATDASQRGAETRALQMCNEAPERDGQGGLCFLYAVGNRVVLARREIRPITP